MNEHLRVFEESGRRWLDDKVTDSTTNLKDAFETLQEAQKALDRMKDFMRASARSKVYTWANWAA